MHQKVTYFIIQNITLKTSNKKLTRPWPTDQTLLLTGNVLTCGLCKLVLISCCPQNSRYICNYFFSQDVDLTPAPCHRRTCMGPWCLSTWPLGGEQRGEDPRGFRGILDAHWQDKYLRFRYISKGLCSNYCFPLCKFFTVIQNWCCYGLNCIPRTCSQVNY